MKVLVVPTGTANTASVLAGLRRVGADPELPGLEETDVANLREAVAAADRVVLPGVGAFAAARATLEELQVVDVLRERIVQGRPTLGICLGLQLLCEGSEESPGVEGLGLLPVTATRFPDTVRVPQLGWNRVEPDADCRLLQPQYAYFANSYRIAEPPPGWATATAEHGGRFVAAVERGPVLACQFHPELSGAPGHALLRRWLEA